MVISCTAKIQYQSQEVDIGSICRVYLDFTHFICLPECICVSAVLSNCITYIDSSNSSPPQSRYRTAPLPHWSLLLLLGSLWFSFRSILKTLIIKSIFCFSCSLVLLSHIQLFVTPWTAAHEAPLSSIISQSLLKLTSIESVMPSTHLILCRPLLLLPSISPSIRVFSNESALHGGQSTGGSASAPVLPMNI